MIDLIQSPVSDPSIVLRYRDRQYAADLIAAALLEFDLFTFIDQHPGITESQLAKLHGWMPRPADVLLTLCRASGFVFSDEHGGCFLTDVGREYLTVDSQWYLGPYYQPIADSPIYQNYLKVLRTGKPANWQSKSDGADWHESMKDDAFAKSFTDLMNCRGIAFGQKLSEAVADEMADRTHLLDVGGGSGIYSATMVARYPKLRATVLEQSPVDAITRREIERLEVADRVRVQTADMFQDDWPTDVDVVLLSNLLHDWDLPEATAIVKKAAEALPRGGLLIIHGAIINADKTGPLPVAEYSALLMNITQGKCYSVSEYAEMVTPFGLRVVRDSETIGDRGFVIAVKDQ